MEAEKVPDQKPIDGNILLFIHCDDVATDFNPFIMGRRNPFYSMQSILI